MAENSQRTVERIKLLIEDCIAHPQYGIGRPEQLRYELSGLWSRRIDHTNRMVYRFDDNVLIIIALRYHYKK